MPEGNVFQAGDTVRLTCEFRDFNDMPKDPSIVKVIIYNQKYEIIHEQEITEQYKESEGNYFYDYETPYETRPQNYYYEWYGEMLGSPSLKRDMFKTVFA